MDKEIEFFTRVLSFEKISDIEAWGEDIEQLNGIFGARIRVVRLKLGNEILELTEYLTPQGRFIPIDSHSNDKYFQHVAIIVSDMDKAYQILRKNKVRYASTAPQRLPETIKNAAGIRAFYFKDPENHVLEILEFPPDKGAVKWHELERAQADKIFLGIDHTAIVVENTEQSLKFYQDALGLEIAGHSENFGTEQEHLNNVAGARLRITGLRTQEDGIAVEFLEYLAPRNSKPFPADSKANDLWHWQMTFVTKKASNVHLLLQRDKFNFISSGVIQVTNDLFNFKKGFLVRDLDGHAARIVEN
jgi:catechol 2,3-dioxygenase-like lactoylglutathione lyase family enzyme